MQYRFLSLTILAFTFLLGCEQDEDCKLALSFTQAEQTGQEYFTVGQLSGQSGTLNIVLTELAGNNKYELGALEPGATVSNDDYSVTYENNQLVLRTNVGGTHSMQVTDSKDCSAEAEFQIPTLLMVEITETSIPTCMGVNDGKIVVKIRNGEDPYELSLYQVLSRYPHSGTTPVIFGTSVIINEPDYQFEDLPSGIFFVGVRDSKFNTDNSDQISFLGIDILATTETQSTFADCPTGEVTVNITTEKTEPYSFKLKKCPKYDEIAKRCMLDCCSSPQPIASSTDGHFKNLDAGSYAVEIVDANGCSSYDITFTIERSSENSPLTLDITSQANSQCLTPNGTIVATGSGSIPPYTYELRQTSTVINEWTDVGNFNSLKEGLYTIYVQDGTGCIKSEDKEVPRLNTDVSYTTTVKPIFELHCNTSGCHDGTIGATLDFTDRLIIKSKGSEIITAISDGSMPPPSYPYSVPLTSEQIAYITCWIEDGCPDN